jgi:hypothetical protein
LNSVERHVTTARRSGVERVGLFEELRIIHIGSAGP